MAGAFKNYSTMNLLFSPLGKSRVSLVDGQKLHLVKIRPAIVKRDVSPRGDVLQATLHVVLCLEYALLKGVYRLVHLRHPIGDW